VCLVGVLLLANARTTTEPTTTVLVAKRAIAAIETLTEPEKFFETRSILACRAPKGCFHSIVELKIKGEVRLRRNLQEGEPIDENAVYTKEALGYSCMRWPAAISIPLHIKSTMITGDVVRPGSKADVVWAYSIEGTCGIKTIFTDLPVIAVEKCGACNDSATPRTRELLVTLAGSPDEAASMRIAAENGEIRLRVKSPGDDPTKEK
jgi:Flp pilus assembly protein CpaB